MHFVVTCRDVAHSASLREAALPDHRRYVDAYADQFVLSGPIVEDQGERRVGQLFVLDVLDREAAADFVAGDPFTVAGVFASVEIARILPRFEDGCRRTSSSG